MHKQTSVFDFGNWRALCLNCTIVFNFFPNTVKLSIVPAVLKICIQRDVFTQWDTASYKQWQTLSWIMHFVGLLWECLSCKRTSPPGFILFFKILTQYMAQIKKLKRKKKKNSFFAWRKIKLKKPKYNKTINTRFMSNLIHCLFRLTTANQKEL